MANQKPKKSDKKPVAKSDTKKVEEEKAKTVTAPVCEKPLKGFFARKCDPNENILTIFKTPKIWGALIGEVVGTMLLSMLLLTLGLSPSYLWMGVLAIYAAIVGISGANLNPLVTAGMMATRRMSAIRGVLYMLAQLLGAWIGLIIVNAFRLGSGTMLDLPAMSEIAGESFWAVALVELMGAMIIAFFFARGLRYARKQPLAFGFIVTSAIMLSVILGAVISQSFFEMSTSFVFNPVVALMYQILPTSAGDFGELASMAGLALAAYVLVPVIGGIIGFYVADVATRLSAGGYFLECDQCCCKEEKK